MRLVSTHVCVREWKLTTCRQRKTYVPRFTTPYNGDAGDAHVITPFFSPETSGEMTAMMVRSATRTLDVYTPSVESWSGCSKWNSPCVGCAPSVVRDEEAFVLFRDLLNAANVRGVRVRLITNKFDTVHECYATISVLSYLSEVIEVRTYATTTFMHGKVIIADNCTAISSVNWSKTSYIENREAGVVVCNEKLARYAERVFAYDWNTADPWMRPKRNGIGPDDVRLMRDRSYLEPFDVQHRNISKPHYSVGAQTSVNIDGADIQVSVSPDNAANVILRAVNETQKTLDIYTYQLTDALFAEMILEIARRKPSVKVRLLMSRAIFMDRDRIASTKTMHDLRSAAGGNIECYSSPSYIRYAHLKIIIIDGASVVVQTGNLSPSDLPYPAAPFEPFGSPGWKSINRDFEVIIRDARVTKTFMDLFEGELRFSTIYVDPRKFNVNPKKGNVQLQ